MTKVLVRYYSSYGHIETMTYAVAEGVREAGAEAVVKRVPELAPLEVAKRAGYKLDQAAPIATVNELEHLGRNPNCLQGASTTPASRRKKQGRSD
jgi:NAD(P)H dehydrogenase (quinone)